jgi:hypothetical protein
MNKQKLTVDVVLLIATELIQQNGSTTTLDVKRSLRAGGVYEAFQGEISNYMRNLFDAGKLSSTNDPSLPYQTYDLPTQAPTAASPAQVNINIMQVAKDVINRATNPALLWILQKFTDNDQVLRSTVTGKGFTSTQTDSALQALLKKNIIVRTGPGEYQMNLKDKTATVPSQIHHLAPDGPSNDIISSDPLHQRIRSIIKETMEHRLGLDSNDPALSNMDIKIVGAIEEDGAIGATEPDLLEIINDLEDKFDINISTPYNTPRELQDYIYAAISLNSARFAKVLDTAKKTSDSLGSGYIIKKINPSMDLNTDTILKAYATFRQELEAANTKLAATLSSVK